MQPSIHLLKSVRPTDITYHPSPEPHSFTPLAISSRRRASARADAPLPVQVLALLAAALCRDGPVIVRRRRRPSSRGRRRAAGPAPRAAPVPRVTRRARTDASAILAWTREVRG
eukprot:COSAG02_NODE_2298_length_9193_cov_83.003189_3_plen_114_part_00